MLFVKLWQFDAGDRTHSRIDTSTRQYTAVKDRPGVENLALFADKVENVRLERWAPRAKIELDLPGGGEFLVLEGGFDERGESFVPHSWLRLPVGDRLHAIAGPNGCKLWVKTGHLAVKPTMPSAAGH